MTTKIVRAIHFYCLVALWVASANVLSLAQFEQRSTRAYPGGDVEFALGDFNGDGKLDLVVLEHEVGKEISVLLGNGDGTFQPPRTISFPGGANWLASADVNNDGKLDLVVVGPTETGFPNVVGVLLGNGDGTFQAPVTSPVSALPFFVTVGDFNNDHKLDVAIIDPPYVSVLLGNGDGTFQAPNDNESFPVSTAEIAVGDFNNDNKLDVVAVGSSGSEADVGILLGNGNGTLQPSINTPLALFPDSVTTGDFNHDGNLDVAVGIRFSGATVLLGNGNATFQPGTYYPTDPGGGQILAADFNRDGKLDLLIDGGSPRWVAELVGNGDGTFSPPPSSGASAIRQSSNPQAQAVGSLAVGDLNGDGLPDAVTSSIFGAITLLNSGVAFFSPTSPIGFHSQLVNTASNPKNIKVTNTGSSVLTISSMKTSGEFHTTSGCGSSVAAGASCKISVIFETAVAGSHQGLITLHDSASSKPQVIELSGIGTALTLSPAALNFGSVKVGSKSPPQPFTVTNVSSYEVKISSIGLGGRDPQEFSETDNCVPQLAPNSSCTVNVTFTPTTTGTLTGQASPVAPGGSQPGDVSLTGKGT